MGGCTGRTPATPHALSFPSFDPLMSRMVARACGKKRQVPSEPGSGPARDILSAGGMGGRWASQGKGVGRRESGDFDLSWCLVVSPSASQLQSPSCPQEKELQRLENLKKKEEAELLRKQKVEEDQRQHLEEIKMVSQEKQKLMAEKAKKKAAKKLEEAEMRLKQEEEAWRQKRLQQEEEWEQKWQRKVAEALRNTVQQGQWERQLALERKVQRKREEERLQAKWDHPHFAEEKPEA
ncbi:uncharacterized protein [Notamacropus eugenii]|uniref:uncharacterized protein isoform X2 n=1 Tax=Notamacropus eugenii TaxID=9315 RepID=UPI003B67CAB5